MTVNYNTLRTMKGMAIGTIMPWSGAIGGTGGIPKGWLPCVGGRIYKINEYPDLYDVIGIRYGGSVSDGYFLLPAITGKSLGDYHPSHANVSGIGYTGNFSSFLGSNTDIANQNVVNQSSNIDLFVELTEVNTMKATLTGMNINSSTYADSFGYVERRLGDLHWGSHSHAGSYDSVRTSNRRIEDCQDSECGDYFANGVLCNGSSCSNCFIAINPCCDVCDDIEYYRCGNASNAIDDFAIPKYDGGEHLGRGGAPYGTDDYKMGRSNDPKNFIAQSDDAVLYNDVTSNWSGIYGTSVDSAVTNFQNSSLTGHVHPDTPYSINTGNVTTKQFVTVNNVETGNLSPVNSDVAEVMTIDFNVATPSLQMLYIIKAY